MDGYSSQQIRAAEAPLLAAGVPLMARAARALADIVWQLLAEANASTGPVLVLVGSGNNGGDALFAAAHLAERGVAVTILPTGRHIHEAGLQAAVEAGARLALTPGASVDAVAAAAARAAEDTVLVIDGILGTGSAGRAALAGASKAATRALGDAARTGRLRVVAVDIPSGLDPDSGEADASVLPATTTVTFGACKAGLLRGDGPAVAGDVRVIDIGLASVLAQVTPTIVAP